MHSQIKCDNTPKICQFITKLLDMMQKFPQNIFWTEKDDQLIFLNLRDVQNLILPTYFRHSNFSSFIRQLNMYGFCKKEKTPDFLRFKHKIFKKGNQPKFCTIKRKSKQKRQQQNVDNSRFELNKLLDKIESIEQKDLRKIQKNLITQLLIQKNKLETTLGYIKTNIRQLIKQSQLLQEVEVKELAKQIEIQFLNNFSNTIKQSQNIDQFLKSVNILNQNQQNKQCLQNYSSINEECSFQILNQQDQLQFPKINCNEQYSNENQFKTDFIQIESKLILQDDQSSPYCASKQNKLYI